MEPPFSDADSSAILKPMFLTTHAAAGILISHHTSDPVAVFGLSFLSHFVLDFIPHGDEEIYHDEEWKVQRRFRRVLFIGLLDVLGVVLLTLWAAHAHTAQDRSLLLLGILGSILPDFLSHLFPVLHEKMSWLFVVRWLYAVTKPTGVRYMVRLQNWIHDKLHHDVIRRDISFRVGLVMQIFLTALLLALSR